MGDGKRTHMPRPRCSTNCEYSLAETRWSERRLVRRAVLRAQGSMDVPEATEDGLIDRLSLGSEVGWRSFGAATAAPLLSLGAGEEAYGLTPAMFIEDA